MNEETLFHEALAKPSREERFAFLDKACDGRPEMRVAVDALLAAHDASGSFLGKQAATGEFTPASGRECGSTGEWLREIAPGTLIAGRYTLAEKIGEGGMGEVWVAKQSEPVKRKVAIKLIKAGMDSKAVLNRFEAERQALALMDHPNIARVFDGGLSGDRRPFFVMELVNGLPLTKYCDEARLPPRQRLELFVAICQAVQHAHQKGIVHRDLKPSNILITLYDGKPVPKVIDFGVAKALAGKLTDESLSTQFGAAVGTWEYMSPEQAGFSAIDIDTRSDIYSLGVILYELLTGLRPFDATRLRQAALDELVRILRQEEPSKPSTRLSSDQSLASSAALRQTDPNHLMALLRGELDWVVMKCLDKQRDRRYDTANALARDVQRFLADEPVEARPASAAYRMQKFIRRHRAMAITAATFAGVVVTAAVVATGLAAWALNAEEKMREALEGEIAQKAVAQNERLLAIEQRNLAKEAEAVAQTQRQLAVAARIRADQEAEIVRDVNRFIKDNLLWRPSGALGGAGSRRPSNLSLYTRARKNLDSGYYRDRPLAQAHIRLLVAEGLVNENSAGAGLQELEKAHALFLQHLGDAHENTQAALRRLASLQRSAAKFVGDPTLLDKAASNMAKWVEVRRANLGKDDTEVASVLANLADIRVKQNRPAEAVPLFLRAIEIQEQLGPKDQAHTQVLMLQLARTYRTQQQPTLAEPLYVKIVDHGRRTSGSYSAQLALFDLCGIYLAQTKYENVESLVNEFLPAFEMTPLAWQLYEARSLLGGSLLGRKKFEEAEKLLVDGYEGLKQRESVLSQADRIYVREALGRLVQLYDATNRPELAQRWRAELEKTAPVLVPVVPPPGKSIPPPFRPARPPRN